MLKTIETVKVLFVTRGFPSERNIMAGNYEAVQAKAMVAKGCQVAVICVYEKPFRRLFEKRKITHRLADGVDVYEYFSCPVTHNYPRINKYFRVWAHKRLFREYYRENGLPDIVHAHIVSTATFAIFLKERYHLPFIITEHWTAANTNFIPNWMRMMIPTYHKADCVICVSQALADSLKRNFHVDATVISNMVDDVFFQTKRVERTDNQFRLIACGAFRSNRNKGFDILIDAFAEAHFPEHVSLDIIGDGEDRPFVESKIAGYGLTRQIHLLGVKTPEEVSSLLSQSDCFVLSSRLETFAIVVIEAMASGLPVIATRCGGPETFLRSEHGILVDKEDVGSLANAMKYMVEHYADYDSNNIRKFCRLHFSKMVIADRIYDVYKHVTLKGSEL